MGRRPAAPEPSIGAALVATSPVLWIAVGAVPVGAVPVVPGTCVSHSASVITVLLRHDHHIDHTFLQATHYQDQDGVLTIYRGRDEVARFPAGSCSKAAPAAGEHQPSQAVLAGVQPSGF